MSEGSDRSQVSLGLTYLGSLVAVVTFNPQRRSLGHKNSTPGTWELVRYATSRQVVGGASKLISAFVKKYRPNQIVSYADRRYTNPSSNLYRACGFQLIGETPPSYWYMRNYKERLHRYGFTKGRLVSKFGASPNLTEWESMQLLGYDRVWDCGCFKFSKTYV